MKNVITPIYFLNRPRAANSLDLATAKEMLGAIDLAIKQKLPGIIIASSLKSVFCAGGDLKQYSKMKTKQQGVSVNRAIRKILSSFSAKPILIVAAVEGDAIGGGCELALACDWIVSSASARFAFRQSQLGLSTGWGGGQKLLHRVRSPLALNWCATGNFISAPEALRNGLVDKVVPKGSCISESEQFINGIAISPSLIGELKNLTWNGRDNLKLEDKIFEKLWWSGPHREKLTSAKKKL